jgi:hypothetical protein
MIRISPAFLSTPLEGALSTPKGSSAHYSICDCCTICRLRSTKLLHIHRARIAARVAVSAVSCGRRSPPLVLTCACAPARASPRVSLITSEATFLLTKATV